MDSEDGVQKELSISLAASTMINASDSLTPEAYQANLQRIHEVKEMVRRLEMNNEAAHKNFIVDQLEKRAKDGREAEDMLVRLRSQGGAPQNVQLAADVPAHQPDVILPTTATLVEVQEPQPIAPTTSATFHNQNVSQSGSNPPWGSFQPQIQPYNDHFRYYLPPHPQHAGVPPFRPAVGQGQTSRSATQHVPPQRAMHNSPAYQPVFQQNMAPQSWINYSPQVVPPPAVAVPVHYAPPMGWVRSPAQNAQNPGFPTPVSRQPGVSTPPTTMSLHPVPIPPQNISPVQVQMPHHRMPSVPATFIQPYPADFRSQPASTAVSRPAAASGSMRPQAQLQSEQSQRLPQPPSLPHSQQHPQRPSQPLAQQENNPQPSQVQLPQLPEIQSQIPQESVGRLPSSTQTDEVKQPAKPRGQRPRIDQAGFNKLFQAVVQRDISQVQAFWTQAKAAGVKDEWLMMAVKSLPPDLLQSVLAVANQSTPTTGAPLRPSTLQESLKSAMAVDTQTPSTTTPLIHTTSAPQQVTIPSATYPLPKQDYAAQLQYYAAQAAQSAFSAQIRVPLKHAAPTPATSATPKRDMPQVEPSVKTPKDANRATLARDVLRSLGKTIPLALPQESLEREDKTTDQATDRVLEADQPTASQSTPSAASPQPGIVLSFVDGHGSSTTAVRPNAQDELQDTTTSGPLTAPKEELELAEETAVTDDIHEPIVIDLTLDNSDESVDGKDQESTLPNQAGSGAAIPSLQSTSATTTTNDTLLENLSLKESFTDVVADDHHADVRMHSPPVSFIAEENMVPELACLPPTSTEPVSSSLELPPREGSENVENNRLPLFLPSPPASPAQSNPPANADLEMIVDENEGRSTLKRRSVDVNEMQVDTNSETPRDSKQRKRRRVYVLVPPAPLYVKRAKLGGGAGGESVESDPDEIEADEEIQYSHFEQVLIEESKSRLSERKCRWLNCGAILNCAANLQAHLKDHAHEEESEAPIVCHWTNCGRQFGVEQEREEHLERHTIRPLPCPFAGCDEQFDKPVQVMEHEMQHLTVDADHGRTLIQKPMCQPIVPAIPARLGPPTHQLPSHRVVPRRVLKCRISAERHSIVGPWVLWNIWSPVDLNARKQNAQMRGRQARQGMEYDIDGSDPRRDDYDFLLALSSYPAKHAPLDDLDSALITMGAARGLTLWAGPDEEPTNDGAREDEHGGEEDIVEGMLMVSV